MLAVANPSRYCFQIINFQNLFLIVCSASSSLDHHPVNVEENGGGDGSGTITNSQTNFLAEEQEVLG